MKFRAFAGSTATGTRNRCGPREVFGEDLGQTGQHEIIADVELAVQSASRSSTTASTSKILPCGWLRTSSSGMRDVEHICSNSSSVVSSVSPLSCHDRWRFHEPSPATSEEVHEPQLQSHALGQAEEELPLLGQIGAGRRIDEPGRVLRIRRPGCLCRWCST